MTEDALTPETFLSSNSLVAELKLSQLLRTAKTLHTISIETEKQLNEFSDELKGLHEALSIVNLKLSELLTSKKDNPASAKTPINTTQKDPSINPSDIKAKNVKYPGLKLVLSKHEPVFSAMIAKDSDVSYINYQILETLNLTHKILKTNLKLVDIAGNNVITEGRLHIRANLHFQEKARSIEIPLRLFVVRNTRVPIVLGKFFFQDYKVNLKPDHFTILDKFTYEFIEFFQEEAVPMLPELYISKSKEVNDGGLHDSDSTKKDGSETEQIITPKERDTTTDEVTKSSSSSELGTSSNPSCAIPESESDSPIISNAVSDPDASVRSIKSSPSTNPVRIVPTNPSSSTARPSTTKSSTSKASTVKASLVKASTSVTTKTATTTAIDPASILNNKVFKRLKLDPDTILNIAEKLAPVPAREFITSPRTNPERYVVGIPVTIIQTNCIIPCIISDKSEISYIAMHVLMRQGLMDRVQPTETTLKYVNGKPCKPIGIIDLSIIIDENVPLRLNFYVLMDSYAFFAIGNNVLYDISMRFRSNFVVYRDPDDPEKRRNILVSMF